ncbi:ATP-binding Cassette (ABC) Superfamily, partial [Thraustotheca clavata]
MTAVPSSADVFLQNGSDVFHANLASRLEASMGKAMPQIEIRFQDLSISAEVTVATKDGHELPTLINHAKKSVMGLLRAKRSLRKDVLHPMSGVLKPGTMTLLLGQPSSGKSSFMKMISGRFPMHKNIAVGGELTYNGAEASTIKQQIPQVTAYMNQRDFHYPTLSVKETLAFAHACAGGAQVPQRVLDSLHYGSPEENAQAKAVLESLYQVYPDIITRQMGLKICEDTIVGNAMLRGVSGGERKRVTVGEMEFGMKQISLMDEISTGLDSAATFDIVKSQKSMAESLKKTIVIALLQPSPEVYNLFDDVLLLNEGHVMYHGPRALALEYFESLGFKCPPKRDVADFLLDIGTPQQDQYVIDTSSRSVPRTPSEYADLFRQSAIYKSMMEHLEGPHHPLVLASTEKHLSEMPAFQLDYATSTKMLIARQTKVFLRNTAFVKSRMFMVLLMGLLYSSTFYNVDPENPVVVLGVIFQSVLFLAMGQVPMMPAVLEAREIYYKQRSANFFRTSSFIFAQSFTQVPFALGETIVFGSLMYWITAFVASAGAFLTYMLLLYLTNLAFASWFFFLAVVSPDLHVAKPLSMMSILVFVLFAGFIISPSIMPDYFIWLYWINPLSWCVRSLAINQYTSHEFQQPTYNGRDYLSLRGDTMGNYMLKTFGLQTDRAWIWYGVIYLVASYFAFLGLSYWALEYHRYDAPENVAVTLEDEEPEDAHYVKAPKTPANAHVEVHVAGSSSSSPPVTLAFKDLWYSVSMAMLCLVPSLLSWFVWCWKTTLMDVIAGRKTGGKIQGQILLNGYPATDLAIRRATGYCE